MTHRLIRNFPCPVCGKYNFLDEYDEEYCPECGWKNNAEQYYNPDLNGNEEKGTNILSLNEARLHYDETSRADILPWENLDEWQDEHPVNGTDTDVNPDDTDDAQDQDDEYSDEESEPDNEMKRDYTSAMELLSHEELTRQEAELLVLLGRRFETGTSYMPPDHEVALICYRAAAECGNAAAQNNVGWMLRNGFGCGKDVSASVKWFELASRSEPLAGINLGSIYENGEIDGVVNARLAQKWYLQSARLGSGDALMNYGNMYFYGSGVEQDYKKAYEVFNYLAENAFKKAFLYLGLYAEHGYISETDYDVALKYYREAMEVEDSFCFTNAGSLIGRGLGHKKDQKLASACYIRAAELGDSLAFTNIAWQAENGTFGKAAVKKAISYYLYAADILNDEQAKEELKRFDDTESEKPRNPLDDFEFTSFVRKHGFEDFFENIL